MGRDHPILWRHNLMARPVWHQLNPSANTCLRKHTTQLLTERVSATKARNEERAVGAGASPCKNPA